MPCFYITNFKDLKKQRPSVVFIDNLIDWENLEKHEKMTKIKQYMTRHRIPGNVNNYNHKDIIYNKKMERIDSMLFILKD